MPRTVKEILEHADELARRFENFEPNAEQLAYAAELGALHQAVLARGDAEHQLVQAIKQARDAGAPWSAIGTLLGTSGEAARQRYGHSVPNLERRAG